MQLELGQKIRELRRRDGRTQEALAEALGVTSQAVSRWEANGGYPDMEMLPSIANFFGITIDELFGYENNRIEKINCYYHKIIDMNRENNGVDTCMDECVSFARNCLAEFPSDGKLMYSLAAVLLNAGYVRHSEHHLTDNDGYDIYDTERHRTYPEWQEAIKLYESLLPVLEAGELRNRAIRELLQLYQNIGEKDKAIAIVNTLPDISSCRELMRINSCDGKNRAIAFAEALLRIISVCSELMISSVFINEKNLKGYEAVEIIKNAIELYYIVMPDGNFGIHHASVACMYLYLSGFLWRVDDRDGAFKALDSALEHAKKNENARSDSGKILTAPVVRLAKMEPKEFTEAGIAANLSEDWPWWAIDGSEKVKAEMQSDPRWNEWVKRTKEP